MDITNLDTSDPLDVNERVVIVNPDAGPLTGMAAVVASVHAGGCMTVMLEKPILGYYFAHVNPDGVERSIYQNEELVAVNNHD